MSKMKFGIKIKFCKIQGTGHLIVKKKGIDVKKASNIGSGLKILVKNSFESPIFFNY
jgi:hypothetical protein